MNTFIQNKSIQLNSNYGSCEISGTENKTTNQKGITYENYNQFDRKITWGRYKTFIFRGGEPLIVFGPHWPIFLLAYIGFWVLSVGMINFQIIQKNTSRATFNLSLLISVVQLISYLLVSIKNPGISNVESVDLHDTTDFDELSLTPRRNTIWYCQRCRLIQQPFTAHCQFCGICISGHDHHCPWTGKCIGANNFKEFLVFVLSTIFLFTTFIVITLKT